MEQKSMTALVSAFARAYHAKHSTVPIFDDCVAGQLLSDGEYGQIALAMAQGIRFFNPAFTGHPREALRWIVDNQLSPTPLGRAAFAERALECEVCIGARQYLILGAGYDTFAWRQPDWAKKVEIFEVDHPATAADKQKRLAAAGLPMPDNAHFVAADFADDGWVGALAAHPAFDAGKITCCALLGVSYYLSRETFAGLVCALGSLLPEGSSLILDYPGEAGSSDPSGGRAKRQAVLAAGAGERMLAGYAYADMERLLADRGWLIYEHLAPEEMTAQYFAAHNRADPAHAMTAFDNVYYCLAVRKPARR